MREKREGKKEKEARAREREGEREKELPYLEPLCSNDGRAFRYGNDGESIDEKH